LMIGPPLSRWVAGRLKVPAANPQAKQDAPDDCLTITAETEHCPPQ
jgi:hypothetical protein